MDGLSASDLAKREHRAAIAALGAFVDAHGCDPTDPALREELERIDARLQAAVKARATLDVLVCAHLPRVRAAVGAGRGVLVIHPPSLPQALAERAMRAAGLAHVAQSFPDTPEQAAEIAAACRPHFAEVFQ